MPILPPSGVSTGQIIPYCVLCNLRCPIIIISPGVFIRLNCDIAPIPDNLLSCWIKPTLLRIVPILNDFLKAPSITLKLNIFLMLESFIMLL